MAGKGHDFESLYKMLIIGNSGVGKTCIMTRFVDDRFERSLLNTIGVDFKTKVVAVGQRNIKLQLWDTAGHERFKTITSAFYRGALGVMVVYDITDRSSFIEVRQWMSNIQDKCDGDKPVVLLLGNKCDLDDRRDIQEEEGKALAAHYQCGFIETSAFRDINIKNAFMEMTLSIIQKETGRVVAASSVQMEAKPRGLTLERGSKSPSSKKSGCCS